MIKSTFDLFDAPLGDAYGYFQGMLPDVRFKLYEQSFCFDPQNWLQFRPTDWVFALNWKEYRYRDVQHRDDLNRIIPEDDPGVYIFYIRPDDIVYKFPQIALYVGISNERNSQRPLRERLKDYVPDALPTIKKRKNIHRMLQLYYEQIWVAFALSTAISEELQQAETLIHGFVYPCYARRDFPIQIKRQQQAFGG